MIFVLQWPSIFNCVIVLFRGLFGSELNVTLCIPWMSEVITKIQSIQIWQDQDGVHSLIILQPYLIVS